MAGLSSMLTKCDKQITAVKYNGLAIGGHKKTIVTCYSLGVVHKWRHTQQGGRGFILV